METTAMFELAGLSTSGVAIVLIAYRVWKTLLGKKLVSNCCGQRLELGMDVQTMTPSATVDTVNPLHLAKSEETQVSPLPVEQPMTVLVV
jgi:hypothetical protein